MGFRKGTSAWQEWPEGKHPGPLVLMAECSESRGWWGQVDTVHKALTPSTEQSRVAREWGPQSLWHCVRMLDPNCVDSLRNQKTGAN